MKKILLVLIAVLTVSMSYAQINRGPVCRDANMANKGAKPTAIDWQPIGQHVTGVDFLSGATISTEAIAQSGKAMVIDFSATWCSWCWVMHSNGILEAIHNQLGNNVEVIWVEADPSTTNPAEITGTGSTQGDWTNGGTVPYPIINDHNFANIIGGTSAISGYPTVVFVSPTGYWCDVYGTDWGFGPYDSTAAVTAIQNVLANQPQPGQPPVITACKIPSTGVTGKAINFSVNVFSVDDYTVSWTFEGGNPTSANTASASCTWNTPGTYNVSVTVTNANGTDTRNGTITLANYVYFFDFEDKAEYNDWTFIDADGDGFNWSLDYLRGQGAAHGESNGMLASASWNSSAGALNPNNWAFTGAITLPDNDNVHIEWYEKGQDANYAAEKYRVYVATSQSIDAATEIGSYTATGSWVLRKASLAAYKGQTVYIAFRHCDVTDMFYLDLDDMGISTEAFVGIENPNTVAMNLYPNPTNGIVNIETEGLQKVEVLDMTGRVVMTTSENNVNMSNLSNGIYMVRVTTMNGITTQKVVKK
ncbi:MAG: choice-of-anchor J domain-containing protein [Bacteroidales bacterium]|nr:choice-of-anchor J domain-containing protein [Bacteroidales bacterium]